MYNEETFKPIDNMVLIKLDPFTDIKGGIILPQEAADKQERLATVVAVGRGYNTMAGITPCNVAPGDRILVHNKSISALEYLDKDRFGVMRDAHIMGIITKPLPVPKPKPKKKLIRIEKTDDKPKTEVVKKAK